MPESIDGPTFGRQLQALRRHNGFTQEDLALALASPSDPASSLVCDWLAWISAAEQGQLSTVERLMVVAVALTLHVPISAFLPFPMAALPEEPRPARGPHSQTDRAKARHHEPWHPHRRSVYATMTVKQAP